MRIQPYKRTGNIFVVKLVQTDILTALDVDTPAVGAIANRLMTSTI
jgi:hypothetical protein